MERGISKNKLQTRQLVVTAMLSAISIFLGLTGLGFIAIPPVKATIMHIPVIIGAIIEGPIVGGLIGLCFGAFSMYQAFTAPTPTSFVFWNPFVAILPRVLIGVVSYYSYIGMKKAAAKNLKLTSILVIALLSLLFYFASNTFFKNSLINLAVGIASFLIMLAILLLSKVGENEDYVVIGTSAILGTLTNTVLVLGLIYVFYVERFAKAINISPDTAGKFIVGIGVTNGIPEALISTLITVPVVIAIFKIKK